MKKRKPPEQSRPEFSNNPFSSLKKIKSAEAPVRRPAEAAPQKAAEGDDEDLFRRAVSGARRLGRDPEQKPDEGPQIEKPAPVAEDDAALFLRAMTGMRRLDPNRSSPEQAALDKEDRGIFVQALRNLEGSMPPDRTEFEEERSTRSPSSRMKQLRRGTIRIGEELDLHGCLREEALIRLQRFIAAASGRGQKAVLVITGKGINSPEGPVLQGAVADWLRGPGKGMVAEFQAAPRDKGGSGAFVVFLKSK
jgi:DNA-nicking Smr family endonuclease